MNAPCHLETPQQRGARPIRSDSTPQHHEHLRRTAAHERTRANASLTEQAPAAEVRVAIGPGRAACCDPVLCPSVRFRRKRRPFAGPPRGWGGRQRPFSRFFAVSPCVTCRWTPNEDAARVLDPQPFPFLMSDESSPSGDSPPSPSAQLRLEQRRRKRQERAQRRDHDGPAPTRPERRRDDEERAVTAPQRRRSPRFHGPEPDRIPVEFDPASLDEGAEKVVRRLTRGGHEAYLVGGCVRDLLVGHRPKDFDVATSARPEEVRALFRNSRIIGRRFRLVHVLFPHGHVIETATFRRNPPATAQNADDSLLIVSDNVFGEAHEDALRRDFTINGLFYDVDQKMVLDWVGGMADIRARRVQTIGDPVVRFQEDPVRMLRAVKFAARIDFGIAPDVYDAAVQCRGALAMAARPRLSEEVLRLMRGGAAHRSIWLLWEMGMLDVLIPELASFVADSESDEVVWNLLSEVDRRTEVRGQPLDDIVLWTVLLLEPLLEACEGEADRLRAAHDFLEPIVERLNLPRRSSDSIRRVIAILPRMLEGKSSRFQRSALYPLALEVLEIRREAVDASTNQDHLAARTQTEPRKRARAALPSAHDAESPGGRDDRGGEGGGGGRSSKSRSRSGRPRRRGR